MLEVTKEATQQLKEYYQGKTAPPMRIFLKNAWVVLDCFKEVVNGYGKYELVNPTIVPVLSPIQFLHFFFEHFYHGGDQITSVSVNGTSIPYTLGCSFMSNFDIFLSAFL